MKKASGQIMLRYWPLLICVMIPSCHPINIAEMLNRRDSGYSICKTDGCARLAKYLTSMIDTSVRPCDDFYMHTCGKLMKEAHTPPPDASPFAFLSTPTKSQSPDTIKDPRTIATENIANATEQGFRAIDLRSPSVPEALKDAKRYYDSCLLWDPASDTNQDQVIQYIKNFASWPFFKENWKDSDFNLARTAGELFGTLEVQTLVAIDLGLDKFKHDKRNTGDFLLYLKPPAQTIELILFPSSYQDQIGRALKNLAVMAGVKTSIQKINKMAGEVYDFEQALSENAGEIPNFTYDDLEALKKYYNPRTFAEMNSYNFDGNSKFWSEFFHAAVRNESQGLAWTEDPKSVICVTHLDHFAYLGRLLSKTPKRIVANYLMWHLLREFGPYLGETYKTTLSVGPTDRERYRLKTKRQRKYQRRYELEIEGEESSKKSATDCFTEVQEAFDEAVGRVYLDKRFPKTKYESGLALTKNLQKAARDMFVQNSWLTSVAKQRILEKVDNMQLNVGYPLWIENDTELNRQYEKWKKIDEKASYFQNSISLKKWNYTEMFSPFERDLFLIPVTSVNNAAYSPVLNALTVPAGDLEFPFFDLEFPDAFNYGILGMTVGHEMSHGFDNFGILYDKDGDNAKSVANGKPWLLDGSYADFTARTQCFIDQYDEKCYEIFDDAAPRIQIMTDLPRGKPFQRRLLNPESDDALGRRLSIFSGSDKRCIDGNQTLGENMADFSGVKIALKAYLEAEERKRTNGKASELDVRLPGLEQYTMPQLFFLAYGSSWCAPDNPIELFVQLVAGEHSPNDARVNEVLKNIPEFAKVFQCRDGSKMKPNTVCSVY